MISLKESSLICASSDGTSAFLVVIAVLKPAALRAEIAPESVGWSLTQKTPFGKKESGP